MKVIKGLVLLCLMMLAGCQSEEETSQFLLACKYDAPATIAAMLDNGIDVDGQDKTGLSGLMVAAAENRRDVVELLLKRRAKPNLQTRQGVTALMLAAARGSDTAIIGDLLQAGSVGESDLHRQEYGIDVRHLRRRGHQKRLSAYSGDEKARCACRRGEYAGQDSWRNGGEIAGDGQSRADDRRHGVTTGARRV